MVAGPTLVLRVADLPISVKDRLWSSWRLEERRFTLEKRGFDIDVTAPCRVSCSSGSRRRSVVRLRAPPPGQWESNKA